MRSTWEIKTAKYLDENNYEWTYEPEAYKIIYNDKIGTFRPDFKVEKNGIFEIWEVKGYWRDDAKVKFDAFVSQYPSLNIKLLQKQELKNMGIL